MTKTPQKINAVSCERLPALVHSRDRLSHIVSFRHIEPIKNLAKKQGDDLGCIEESVCFDCIKGEMLVSCPARARGEKQWTLVRSMPSVHVRGIMYRENSHV
jgi:hypothetical protein